MQRRIEIAVAGALLVVIGLSGLRGLAEKAQNTPASHGQQTLESPQTASADETPYVFRVTTREVAIAVIARDRHNRLINDMTGDDFQIFEVDKHRHNSPLKILAFHVVHPNLTEGGADAPSAGFKVTSGTGCAISTNAHYELVTTASPVGGFHEILVTARRPHVTLSFRREYYVGETAVKKPQSQTRTAEQLQASACYHSQTPNSILLTAHLIGTGSKDTLRYSLVIQADSLAFIALSGESRLVQLDYGVCTFDSSGATLEYLHTSVARVLTPAEYERALAVGFPNALEMPKSAEIAVIRFVVRDRGTGNMGSIDVVLPPAVDETAKKHKSPAAGSLRAFGTVVPIPGSFCGDAYELPEKTASLPDFWDMTPIGTVYATALNVPDQDITDKSGIPGVTDRVDWFGIDYYGEFWIEKPGEYGFKLSSDDGAILFIDDNVVINQDGSHPAMTSEGKVVLDAGRHTIHVPYFQGPPMSVALVLEVKPPGEKFTVFDLKNFGPRRISEESGTDRR